MSPIALLTDFGTADHFVGTMKGVMLGIAPELRFTDISHQIPFGDIQEAAFQLLCSYSYFPEGSIFLVVVDPGVGMERKGIIVKSARHIFVGPDNGVLSLALADGGLFDAFELRDRRFSLPAVSATFHGRDVFAPAAAWAARGLRPSNFGPPVQVVMRDGPRIGRDGNHVRAEVLSIDRFGNMIISAKGSDIGWMNPAQAPSCRVWVNSMEVRHICRTFGEVPGGDAGMVIGSSGFLEIVVNRGSAQVLLQGERGTKVDLELL